MKQILLTSPRMFPRYMGRARTTDEMITFDRNPMSMDGSGNMVGRSLGNRYRTHDNRTVDSTGAFLVGELERLDLTLNEPLTSVSWGRDIDLREDVTIADEVSSFTKSQYGSAGGLGTGNGIGNGKAWVGKTSDQITGVSVDMAKVPNPLHPWAMEIKFAVFELESAAKLGRPIDQQKYDAMQLKYQMDVDEQVYIGDTSMSDTGLVNSTAITPVNVPNGGLAHPYWSSKTPDEILADVNLALTTVWAASSWAVVPNRILIPPAQFGQISTQKVSDAGNVSVLRYIQENNLLTSTGRGKLDILPLKWLIGAAAGGTIGTVAAGTDRMVVYTKEKRLVRFPMTLLQRTPVQYDSLFHKSTYFGRLGVVEMVYPETIGYFDLI
jgi:hypothetical protein